MEVGAGQPCASPFTRAPPLLAHAIHDPRDLDTIAKWVTRDSSVPRSVEEEGEKQR